MNISQMRATQSSSIPRTTQISSNNSIYICLLFIFLLFQQAQCSRSHLQKHNIQQQSSFYPNQRLRDEREASRYLESVGQNFMHTHQPITSIQQKYKQNQHKQRQSDDSYLKTKLLIIESINSNSYFKNLDRTNKDGQFIKQKNQQIIQEVIEKPLNKFSIKIQRLLTQIIENNIEENNQNRIIKNQQEIIYKNQKQQLVQINPSQYITTSKNQDIDQVRYKNKSFNQNISQQRQNFISSSLSYINQKQLEQPIIVGQDSSIQNTQFYKAPHTETNVLSTVGIQQYFNKRPNIPSYNTYYAPSSQYQYLYPYPIYQYQYNPYILPYVYPYLQYNYFAITPQPSTQPQVIKPQPQPTNSFGNIAKAIIKGATLHTKKQQNISITQNVPTEVVQKQTQDGIKTTSIIPIVNNQTLTTLVTNNIVNAALKNIITDDNQNFNKKYPDQKVYGVRNLSINSSDSLTKPKILIDNVIATTVSFSDQPYTTIIRVIEDPNNTISGNLSFILNDIQEIFKEKNAIILPPASNSTPQIPIQVQSIVDPTKSILNLNLTQITKLNSTTTISNQTNPNNTPSSLNPLPVNPKEETIIPDGLRFLSTGQAPVNQRQTSLNPPKLQQIPNDIISDFFAKKSNQSGYIQPERSMPITKELPFQAQRVRQTKMSYEDYVAKFRPNYASKNMDQLTTYRRTIFNLNIQKIQQVNRNEKFTYTYTVNRYSSAEIRQFNKQYGNLLSPDSIKFANEISFNQYTFPDKGTKNINWTCASRIPITQGSCGSCYAISVVDTVEITFQMYNLSVRDLSINEVMACDDSSLSGKCNGGFFPTVYDYIIKNGVGFGAAYRYLQISKQNKTVPPCDKDFYFGKQYNQTRVFIQKKQRIKATDCKQLVQQLKFRAITVGIAAGGLQLYSGGRYEIKTKQPIINQINHGVVLLGYDQELGFWYKNSWGLGWGIGGYGFMDHTAGICLHGHYGILKNENLLSGPNCPQNFTP